MRVHVILLSKLEKYSVHTQKSIKDFAVFLKHIYLSLLLCPHPLQNTSTREDISFIS